MATQSDVLQLVASIKDNFTPALQKMVRELRTFTGYSQQTHKEGTVLAQKHGVAFQDLRKAVQGTSETIKGVLTPAMAGLGIGTLSAGAAIAGLTSGVKSLAESWRNVKFVARDAGLPPDVVRTYENAGRFIGQSAEAMDGMLRTSALLNLSLKHGFGTAADWFRQEGRGMEDSRIYIQQAGDAHEYLNRVIEVGSTKVLPELRRKYFESMTGMADLANLTAENLKIVQHYLTNLTDKQKEDLTKLHESFTLLGLSWQNFREGIEADLTPALLELSKTVRGWLDGPAKEYVAAAKTWIEQNPGLVKILGEAAIAVGGLTVAGGALAIALGAINLALSPEIAALGFFTAAIWGAYEAGKKLKELLPTYKANVAAGISGPTALPPGQSALTMGLGKLKGALGFAEGGIVTGPTHALLGESGPEAVIPLDKFGGKKETATEVTVRAMLQAVLRIEEIWRNFTGAGRGAAGVGGGGATPGGGGGTAGGGAGHRGQRRILGGGAGAPGGFHAIAASKADQSADANLIRRLAKEEGVDPDTAVAVARSEGLGVSWAGGDKGSSFGAFQAHFGGIAPGMMSRGQGDVMASQGINAKDPAQKEAVYRWQLRYAKTHGWGEWYGAKRVGIGQWQGLRGDGRATPAADNSATQGRAHPISGRVSDIGGGTLPAGQLVPGMKELEAATAGIPGGRRRISSENDPFHHRLSYHSKHVEGLAFDQSLVNAGQHVAAAAYVRDQIRKTGLTDKDFKVIDEYAHPSRAATGGHIHSQFNTAAAAARFKAAMGGKDMSYGPQLPAKGAGMEYGPQLPGHTPVVDTNAPKGRATPAEAPAGGVGGGAGGGGGGGACDCAGAMSASASGLGGIVGMLFGKGGAQNMLGSMMGAMSGHARGSGLLGGLFGGGGGPMGFLGGALGRTMAGAMSHKVEGAANLDINLKGFPKHTNIAGAFEGLFKQMNVSRQPTMPTAQSF